MQLTATSCYDFQSHAPLKGLSSRKQRFLFSGPRRFALASTSAAALDGAVNKRGLSIAKTEV
jgi:hypothetical protein